MVPCTQLFYGACDRIIILTGFAQVVRDEEIVCQFAAPLDAEGRLSDHEFWKKIPTL
jgi:hypothetical protein